MPPYKLCCAACWEQPNALSTAATNPTTPLPWLAAGQATE